MLFFFRPQTPGMFYTGVLHPFLCKNILYAYIYIYIQHILYAYIYTYIIHVSLCDTMDLQGFFELVCVPLMFVYLSICAIDQLLGVPQNKLQSLRLNFNDKLT